MENASKALLIAGGILLAMLTAAMLMLLNNNIQTLKNAESEKAYQEQLTAFNMGFEAYNKKIMYGTDVISVINKAVDTNKLVQLTNGDENDKKVIGYVNIVLIVNKKFKTTVEKRYYEANGNLKIEDEDDGITVNEVKAKCHITEITEESVKIGESSLGSWKEEILRENDEFINCFNSTATNLGPLNIIDNGTKVDYYVYNALTNFKKATFTCSRVEYDNRSGRIKELTFTQVEEK